VGEKGVNVVSINQAATKISSAFPGLDQVATRLKSIVEPVLGEKGPHQIKDALYGVWLGHPLHPAVTDIPIGCWTSSLIFDIVGYEKAADLSLKLGTVSALGAAATGFAQWYDLQEMEEPRRLGALHAMANIAATGLYGTSWMLRQRGNRETAILCSTIGCGIASASAWLGGDLSFRLGIGVNRIAFEEPSTEWADAIEASALVEGKLTRAEVDGVAIVLLKQGADIHAISATCTHVGGPLDEGTVENACVTCPWHASVFDMKSGEVVHGPASHSAQVYDTRIEQQRVQVRLRKA
jgi:nitrite reductase/ring-hydroxylating ferredoxin subunit/uncharacterized membrane protein